MIRQEIYIKEYNWHIACYYAVDKFYTDEIAERLTAIGCEKDYLYRTKANMSSGKLNHGLCYSNIDAHESILVVGLTSTAAEFMNSLCHELHHLVQHISKGCNIDTESEESAYLSGNIAHEMYLTTKNLLCQHCREHNL